MYPYDVFICCKSEDYALARNVYNFLVKKGYRVFLADTELRIKGVAEYGKVIDIALDSAKHLILVTSKKEYVETSYVESEWRTFIEEKRSGRKQGNLLTVLQDIDVSSLPISLRIFQSFPYSEYYNIVDYLPECGQAINEDFNPIESRLKIKPIINLCRKYWMYFIFCLALLSFYLMSIKPKKEETYPNISLSYIESTKYGEYTVAKDGEYFEIKEGHDSFAKKFKLFLAKQYLQIRDRMTIEEFMEKKRKEYPADFSKPEFENELLIAIDNALAKRKVPIN